jgi:hypothetical protein
VQAAITKAEAEAAKAKAELETLKKQMQQGNLTAGVRSIRAAAYYALACMPGCPSVCPLRCMWLASVLVGCRSVLP